ncbi:hypothetical protein E0H68_06285 [Rhizobium leguminosarum bv. viciae]|uniref:hypothetical protein n=1 Tax=Rhizobium leguminosarum TaxID=384 RepID=UPI001038815E|nr:hypothetical protein [Rhizobium leguminosarum]TCA17379.1 hypothetical protein E0H68_06285 [Rhizobium leguminosarum bv. viciae]
MAKSAKTKQVTDPMAKLRKSIAKKLHGFTADYPDYAAAPEMNTYKPTSKRFPVPELVLFTLRNIMGWRWSGHGEKVRWTVYGSVDGEPIFFSLQKFGFAIGRKVGGAVANTKIEGQLVSALKEVEKALETVAEHQVAIGDVLIVNRFGEFDTRYRFYRKLADKAFKKASRKPRVSRSAGSPFGLADVMNRLIKAKREGFFHSVAMVDCYFSALEHRLVLLRAFTGKPLSQGEVIELLSAKWDDKLKMVIPVAGNRKLELLLGRMREIKERIRNPFSHGGVENDGGSMFFHLPTIGQIPVNFSKFGNSVRFSFLPVEEDGHSDYCKVFDEVDEILSSKDLAGPHALMDAGVDPSFDAETLKRYANAIAGTDADLRAFLDEWGHLWTMHANMDY